MIHKWFEVIGRLLSLWNITSLGVFIVDLKFSRCVYHCPPTNYPQRMTCRFFKATEKWQLTFINMCLLWKFLEGVNYYHKALHLGFCSSPRPAPDIHIILPRKNQIWITWSYFFDSTALILLNSCVIYVEQIIFLW